MNAATVLAFAAATVMLIGPCLLRIPLVTSQSVGPLPVLNWLLYVYALPALLAAGFAALLCRAGKGVECGAATVVSIALTVVFVTLEVRQGFQGPVLDAARDDLRAGLIEWATYPIAWSMLGLLLLLPARRLRWPLFIQSAYTLQVIALVVFIAAVCGALNPLWSHEPVGPFIVLNALLYIYGLPAALAAAFARAARPFAPVSTRNVATAAALTLLMLLITLQVRHVFHRPYLDGPKPGEAEWYTYSAAWVVSGVLLLIAGIAAKRRTAPPPPTDAPEPAPPPTAAPDPAAGAVLRWASLIVMAAAIIKVFVFDTRQLDDLLRVFSFLLLGVTLLGLGYLYQRFVFARPGGAAQP
jgi:uncharacterized membrane protein